MKPIPDFPDYFVDRSGNVYSKKYGRSPRVLRCGVDSDGYLGVVLRRYGKSINKKVHHLVLDTFRGPRPNGTQACHNDGNKKNNSLGNLRWDTAKANGLDNIKRGVSPRGERNGSCKLDSSSVLEIRRLFSEGLQQNVLSARFGISKAMICLIVNRQNWRHLPT